MSTCKASAYRCAGAPMCRFADSGEEMDWRSLLHPSARDCARSAVRRTTGRAPPRTRRCPLPLQFMASTCMPRNARTANRFAVRTHVVAIGVYLRLRFDGAFLPYRLSCLVRKFCRRSDDQRAMSQRGSTSTGCWPSQRNDAAPPEILHATKEPHIMRNCTINLCAEIGRLHPTVSVRTLHIGSALDRRLKTTRMKILALIDVSPYAPIETIRTEIVNELKQSLELFASGVLREAYATAVPCRVVFVLETDDTVRAHEHLHQLPLVVALAGRVQKSRASRDGVTR